MKIKELHLEIVKQLEKRADPKIASKKIAQAEYFRIGYKSYGIRESEERELINRYLKRFKQLSLEERFELVKMLFSSLFSEQAAFGNAIMELSLEDLNPAHYGFLDEIVAYLSNWAETDWLCIRIMQPLLRKYPKETLGLMRKWNVSENMWKRRASVVTFTRKIGESGRFTDEVLELCNNLIWDKEDFVRKGVGWALKDNMRGAKQKVLQYVKSLRRKGVSSVITLYAIRDLKCEERKEVLNIKPNTTYQ